VCPISVAVTLRRNISAQIAALMVTAIDASTAAGSRSSSHGGGS
jgi:hypothetical protein